MSTFVGLPEDFTTRVPALPAKVGVWTPSSLLQELLDPSFKTLSGIIRMFSPLAKILFFIHNYLVIG